MIGFTSLGDPNKIAMQFNETKYHIICGHPLTFMMRGVFNNKEHTVAHYPTTWSCRGANILISMDCNQSIRDCWIQGNK